MNRHGFCLYLCGYLDVEAAADSARPGLDAAQVALLRTKLDSFPASDAKSGDGAKSFTSWFEGFLDALSDAPDLSEKDVSTIKTRLKRALQTGSIREGKQPKVSRPRPSSSDRRVRC